MDSLPLDSTEPILQSSRLTFFQTSNKSEPENDSYEAIVLRAEEISTTALVVTPELNSDTDCACE